MLTFNEIIESFARTMPSKVVVNDEIRKLTYKNLESNGIKLANYLNKMGIRKGDRVAFLAFNCIEFSEILYSVSKLGAIIVPINFRLSSKEVIDIWKNAKPKCLVFQEPFLPIYTELLNKKLIKKKKMHSNK